MKWRYQNPIIPGSHPDPSICRAGDDFYIVNSSFEFFPALPVHHGRDLVHWHCIGHVVDRPEYLDLTGVRRWSGVWAPTIRHHAGTFYVVWTDMRNVMAPRVVATADARLLSDERSWAGNGAWYGCYATSTGCESTNTADFLRIEYEGCP